jgi:hypothetical protein
LRDWGVNAKLRGLGGQAVPALILKTPVIDETNMVGSQFAGRAAIHCNFATEQNTPPINADRTKSCVIGVNRRPNTEAPNLAQRLQSDGQDLMADFLNRMLHLVCAARLSQCLSRRGERNGSGFAKVPLGNKSSTIQLAL